MYNKYVNHNLITNIHINGFFFDFYFVFYLMSKNLKYQVLVFLKSMYTNLYSNYQKDYRLSVVHTCISLNISDHFCHRK